MIGAIIVAVVVWLVMEDLKAKSRESMQATRTKDLASDESSANEWAVGLMYVGLAAIIIFLGAIAVIGSIAVSGT